MTVRQPRLSDLARFRVHDILLVSSLYDAFILAEDGELHEVILKEFLALTMKDKLTQSDRSKMLFNTFAALSTSLSVVVRRTHNSLLLFVATLTLGLVAGALSNALQGSVMESAVKGFFRYPFPPFELLHDLGKGEYAEQSLTVAGSSIPKSVACVAHSLMLAVIYGGIGIFLLGRRQFLTQRE